MHSISANRRALAYLFVITAFSRRLVCCTPRQSPTIITTSSSSSSQLQRQQNLSNICIRGGSSTISTPNKNSIDTSTMIAAEEKVQVQTETSTATTNREDDQSTLLVFSDVDGTLVHYPDGKHATKDSATTTSGTDDDESSSMICLPPSSTGMRGIISSKTLRLAQRLRSEGCVKFVLVSGMRTTTLLKRLPYLPKADAYACDAGGRIFYPINDLSNDSGDGEYAGPVVTPVKYEGALEKDLASFGIQEDDTWKSMIQKLDAAGEDGYDDEVPIQERKGLLWDFARTLISEGYVIDYKGYSTCFRVNRKQQTGKVDDSKFASLQSLNLPEGISTSVNLGCVDFYPSMSGKKNCCQYLAAKFAASNEGSLAKSALCICDDDNDLEMALACKHAFIPGVTSESMAKTIAENPGRFTVTEDIEKNIIETAATEIALDRVLEMIAKE